MNPKYQHHNGIDYPEYVPPPLNVLATNIQEFRFLLQKFCARFKLDIKSFHVDEEQFVKACLKTDRQKLRYKLFHGIDLSELKVAGILAYWIIRFKPLVHDTAMIGIKGRKCLFAANKYNEMFALYLMFATLDQYSVVNDKELLQPTKRLVKNLHYVLLHRPLSEDLMAMLLDPIGEMLKNKA